MDSNVLNQMILLFGLMAVATSPTKQAPSTPWQTRGFPALS